MDISMAQVAGFGLVFILSIMVYMKNIRKEIN